MQANNGNIEIKQNGKEGDVCVRSMNLKLLSRIPVSFCGQQ